MRRRTAVWAFPAFIFLLVGSLVYLFRDFDEREWPDIAAEGCHAGIFTMPRSLIPPELRDLLGAEAPAKEVELQNALAVTVSELAARELSTASINLNCGTSDYDSNALNVYVIGNDPEKRFAWARGMILTRDDGHQVLVMGDEFWDFFGKAWKPILNWRKELSSPVLDQALGDYYFELYQFYLEWAIAHELGHMRLGHHPQTTWWDNAEQRRLELQADVEAARAIRGNYMQITPQLLGLISETMKYEFERTYHRPWSASDQEPFRSIGPGFVTSAWTIELNHCNSSHPPFLLRSLSMVEASAQVGIEQAQKISKQMREDKREALLQEGSIESQLALEEMQAGAPEKNRDSNQWSTALLELVSDLRNRIILKRRIFSLRCPD